MESRTWRSIAQLHRETFLWVQAGATGSAGIPTPTTSARNSTSSGFAATPPYPSGLITLSRKPGQSRHAWLQPITDIGGVGSLSHHSPLRIITIFTGDRLSISGLAGLIARRVWTKLTGAVTPLARRGARGGPDSTAIFNVVTLRETRVPTAGGLSVVHASGTLTTDTTWSPTRVKVLCGRPNPRRSAGRTASIAPC